MPSNISYTNTGRSVVLVADQLNLSILKPTWLVDQGVILRSELGDQYVVTPGTVLVPTRDFELVMLPNRLQVRLSPDVPNVSDILNRVIGRVVEILPHTPFVQGGFNFDYRFDARIHFAEWNRTAFAAQVAKAAIPAAAKNPLFGTYFSFDVPGMRVKVDIKPVRDDGEREVMNATLNFHTAFVGEIAKSVMDLVGRWKEAEATASALANQIASGVSA